MVIGRRSPIQLLLSNLPLGLNVIQFLKAHKKTTKRNIYRFVRRKRANVWRDRDYAISEYGNLTDAMFKRMFRIDRDGFDDILSKIESKIQKNERYAKLCSKHNNGARGQVLSPRIMLMGTLRWMAGGCYLDICMAMHIGFGSFFGGVLWPTMEAIDDVPEFQIGLPVDNADAMKRLAEEFASISPAGADVMYGAVTAVDGWVCHTRQPTEKEVGPNIRRWRNRKGIWGFTVLGGCDARTKFTMWSMKVQGRI